MTAKLPPIRSDSRGAAVIELALVAPILAAMVIGMIDLGAAYSTKVQLEQVAQRIVEKAQQNGYKESDAATLQTEATTAATAANITGSSATVTDWMECTNSSGTTTRTTYTSQCNTNDTYARYMQIDIQASYRPIILARFAGMTSGGSGNSNWTLHGVAGVRIE